MCSVMCRGEQPPSPQTHLPVEALLDLHDGVPRHLQAPRGGKQLANLQEQHQLMTTKAGWRIGTESNAHGTAQARTSRAASESVGAPALQELLNPETHLLVDLGRNRLVGQRHVGVSRRQHALHERPLALPVVVLQRPKHTQVVSCRRNSDTLSLCSAPSPLLAEAEPAMPPSARNAQKPGAPGTRLMDCCCLQPAGCSPLGR